MTSIAALDAHYHSKLPTTPEIRPLFPDIQQGQDAAPTPRATKATIKWYTLGIPQLLQDRAISIQRVISARIAARKEKKRRRSSTPTTKKSKKIVFLLIVKRFYFAFCESAFLPVQGKNELLWLILKLLNHFTGIFRHKFQHYFGTKTKRNSLNRPLVFYMFV